MWKIVLLFTLLIHNPLFAQKFAELKGIVTDEETNTPISNASVYINSTTIGTYTNPKGEFKLINIRSVKFELIVSCIGYQTSRQIIVNNLDPLKLTIKLKPIAKELESVTVTPFDKDGWTRWGSIFEEKFIGKTTSSKKCRIKNPEVLRFKRSENKEKLIVYSTEPLNIVNLALGYNILFDLEDFTYYFNNDLVSYRGYAYYKVLPEEKKETVSEWEKNREKAYNGSLLHFMRSLYKRNVSEEGFDVYRKVVNLNREKIRVRKILEDSLGVRVFNDPNSGNTFLLGNPRKSDSLRYYNAVIRQPDNFESIDSLVLDLNNFISFSGDSIAQFQLPFFLNIKFNREEEEPSYTRFSKKIKKSKYQLSSISIPDKKSIYVLPNGFFYEGENLMTFGYWAWEGIAEMLPFDYISK